MERSVFLIEPKENGWGVEGSGDVPLAPGQTYAALLTDRPLNYLMTRVLNPISSTVSELPISISGTYGAQQHDGLGVPLSITKYPGGSRPASLWP